MIQILVVEDVAEMGEMLRHFLSEIPGFKVVTVAENGWQARMELDRRRPDLILLDEILPGESSADLLAEFLAQGVPVVLMTGVSAPTHPIPGGAAGRFIKPSWKTLEQERPRVESLLRAALKVEARS